MNHRDIRFLKFLFLRGPNIWTYRPVLEAWVDIGELEDCPSNIIPGFVDRLCTWLPTLAEHRCSYGEPGGFVRRLQEGTWPAHILEHITLELQNLVGLPGGFGKARETGVRGVYKVVVSAQKEESTKACMEAARHLVMAAIENTPFDLEATLAQLRQTIQPYLLDPSTSCIITAATAKDRRIPLIHLSDNHLVQLGYGNRQHRIWAGQTDRTSAIAEGISEREYLSRRLLESCGLPVLNPDDDDSGHTGKPHRLLVVGGVFTAACRLDPNNDTTTDVTKDVHPGTAAAASLATRVIGLDIADVDIIVGDISKPLAEQGGAITALHAKPCLGKYLLTASSEPRPIGRAIVDHLFPGDSGRIPVVGITGSSGRNDVARLVAEFSRLGGKLTGLACGEGFYLNRRQLDTGDCGNWWSGTRALMNSSVETAVLENSGDVILSEGLAYDRCQIGVITRVNPASHYGRYHIEKPEQVFQIMRTQVDVILPTGAAVLNAADPMTMELKSLCDGEVILFGIDPNLPAMTEHSNHGGRVVYLDGDALWIASATEKTSVAPLSEILFMAGTPSNERKENVLAAVATAWAMGIALHVIRTGLETFPPSPMEAN